MHEDIQLNLTEQLLNQRDAIIQKLIHIPFETFSKNIFDGRLLLLGQMTIARRQPTFLLGWDAGTRGQGELSYVTGKGAGSESRLARLPWYARGIPFRLCGWGLS